MNSIKQEEDDLFAEWKGQQKNWVKDGVVNPDIFTDSYPKVLYILKEANGGKDKTWIYGDLREYLNKYTDKWQTWNIVARWQYGILHFKEEIDWKKIDEISNDFRKKMLQTSAIINLKKVPGNKQSNMKEIKDFAQKDIDFIKAQISIYKPNIVICGGTGDVVKELKLFGEISKWKKSIRDIEYCDINNIIILKCKHPGVRISKKKIFWDLVHTLREV